jgi:hypothetical protein
VDGVRPQENGVPLQLTSYTSKGGDIEFLRKRALKSVHFTVLIGVAPPPDDDLKARLLQWIKDAEKEVLRVAPEDD